MERISAAVDTAWAGAILNSAPVHSLKPEQHHLLKKLIWAYFLLLIFEGALRKWVLPGLSTPLLVVRDPIALWIIVLAWRQGLLPATPLLFGMIIITTISLFATILFGHGKLWVGLFGARILMLHYPVIFAIGRVFTREDVVKVGKATLWIAIPVAVLTVLQFYSPQSAWVNRGVGGDLDGSGFSGALGFFRPASIFSFTTGTTLFYGFVAAFMIYFWFNRQGVNTVILVLATIAVFVVIPFSISRGLFFGVCVSIMFALFAMSRKPRFFRYIIPAVLGTVVMIVVLTQFESFNKAIEVFTVRFETANETEGGLEGVLLDRYLGGMVGALQRASEFPFFGLGIGLGTNVGSMLTRGEVIFIISEGEWGRVIGEMGALLGLLVIFIRLSLCAKISLAAYRKLIGGDLLPWLLLSFCLVVVPQGQWGQPTTLGFGVLIGGLTLASLRVTVTETLEPETKDNERAINIMV